MHGVAVRDDPGHERGVADGGVFEGEARAVLDFAPAGSIAFGGSFSSFSAGAIVRQSDLDTTLLNGVSNSFNGTVQVTGGILQSGNAGALGNASATVQVQSAGTLQMAGNDVLNGPGLFTIAAGGTLDTNGFQQNTPVSVVNNGAILLAFGSNLSVGGGAAWTGASSGFGSLTFTNSHSLNAGTSLSHSGGTNLTAGTLFINTSNALPDTGLLHLSGGTLFHTGPETVDSVLMDGGNLSASNLTATGTMDIQQGTASGNITVNGTFTKTTAATANFSSGTLTLAGGGTISAGQLSVGGTVAGSFVNSATVSTDFGGVVNGPLTNFATVNVNSSGSLNGATVNAGTINLAGGSVTGTVANLGTINGMASGGGTVSADVSGPGNLIATSSNVTLSGTNSYTGGSIATNSSIDGTTDSIQGAWAIPRSGLVFNQLTPGTMAGTISGSGAVVMVGVGKVTLSASNTFTGGVNIGTGAHFGIGNNTAVGVGGLIGGFGNFKISAEGGARTVANPVSLTSGGSVEFTGTNDLTFTDLAPQTVGSNDQILHTSTGTTTVSGTFFGQNTTAINVIAGKLVLGQAVNNGFRMDGAINVASGGTLQMISNSPVKLGPTNLTGGTLIAPNGVAVPTGLALTAMGTIQGRVSSEAGSLIEAIGTLTLGDAKSFGGFFSNGELRTGKHSVTLDDKNQAVLGSLTELGISGAAGTLTAANGVFVDFGRAVTGYGTVAGTNALPQATIINGDAAGNSGTEHLDFTGYVKGIGTFTDVTFSGTFSPGLSPAIVPVNGVGFGGSNTLVVEIGGLTAGSQFDQLDIGGTLGLNGLLDVDLINGFNPASGNVFNILDGATSGTFNSFSFPALSPGLAWDTTDLYTLGNLKVVPEPTAFGLMLFTAAGLLRQRRR